MYHNPLTHIHQVRESAWNDLLHMLASDMKYGYHYTSIDCLYSIIEGIKDGKLIIHATYIGDFADREEYKHGYALLNDALPQIEKELGFTNPVYQLSKMWEKDTSMPAKKIRDFHYKAILKNHFAPFVISLSQSKDSPYMWEFYGGNHDGVSIILDTLPYQCFNSGDGKVFVRNLFSLEHPVSIPVSYCQKELSRHLKCVVQFFYEKYMKKALTLTSHHDIANEQLDTTELLMNTVCALIKGTKYQEEKETRILAFCSSEEEIKRKKDDSGNRYIEVSIPLDYLKGIIVGPKCNFAQTRDEILARLESKGAQPINISRSILTC